MTLATLPARRRKRTTATAAKKKSPVAVVRFETGKDWWESIGCVPLNRVVFDPPPGAATWRDVVSFDDHQGKLCELINGTLVEKPTGQDESEIGVQISHILKAFVSKRKLGRIAGADGMIRLVNRRVRMPDVAFYTTAERAKGRRGDPTPWIVPTLAVEVVSPGNTKKEMAIKLAEYFQAGTRLVWYVYPKTKTIDVYTAVDAKTTIAKSGVLTGGTVLPGLKVRVADIFDVDAVVD